MCKIDFKTIYCSFETSIGSFCLILTIKIKYKPTALFNLTVFKKTEIQKSLFIFFVVGVLILFVFGYFILGIEYG